MSGDGVGGGPQPDFGFDEMSDAELDARWSAEMADKPGECCCPVFEDGTRGFRQKCPVHGGRSRADFVRLTALRAEIATRVRPPASVRVWGKS